jgi:hypothetical protein
LTYGGRRSVSSGAALLAILGDSYGLGIDFTARSMAIADSGTPANNYDSTGTVLNGALVGCGGKLAIHSACAASLSQSRASAP